MLIIGFSCPKKQKLTSVLIKTIEKTTFSHVYIKLYDPRIDSWIVYEASGLTTHCSLAEDFYFKNNKIYEKELKTTPQEKKLVLTKVYKNLNKPYGIKQLLGLGLVRLGSLFGIKIKNPFKDGNKTYVCSEYVGEVLITLGYEIEDLDDLTPKGIYELLNGQT